MSDEFKKKLAEIASCVKASIQKTSNAAAEKAADVAKAKAKAVIAAYAGKKQCA